MNITTTSRFYTKNRLSKEQDNSDGRDVPVATESFCSFGGFNFM